MHTAAVKIPKTAALILPTLSFPPLKKVPAAPPATAEKSVARVVNVTPGNKIPAAAPVRHSEKLYS